jgi:two-component system cell cycle sensor histidine kinase/response regulator CckA
MSKPLAKVLFMEDSADDGLIVQLKLKDLADVKVCTTWPEFQEALRTEQWDTILVDYHLHGITGEEAIKMARKAQPEVPVIIVSGSINDTTASIACKAGASDYVLKDRLDRLPMAIAAAQEMRQLRKKQTREQRLELLGDLSAGVAHDMNNLLSVMVLGIDQVRRNINPDDEKILDVLEGTSKRGAELMKQMLAFARGNDSGIYKVVTSEYLVGEIGAMLRGTFPANIRLQITTGAGTAHIRCDATQINQVLLNLCINARDAMPDGGELTITTQNRTMHKDSPLGLEGKFVCVTVRDTGSGIPAAVLPQIFEPFFTTKHHGGTGLGIVMVKTLIAAHGGAVDVKSDSGGTTFSIYLPVASEAIKRKAEVFDGKGRTVLLVDDTEFIRIWIRLLLEESNYKVIEAGCGTEAMNLFMKHTDTIDVVVTDVAMPLMNGPQLVRALRELVVTMPVIYITGLDSGGLPRDPEANATLQKPFSRESLLSTLKQVLP